MMVKQDLAQQFLAAWYAGTPLLAVVTPDPGATLRTLRAAVEKEKPPLLRWNCMEGIVGVNEPGVEAAAAVLGGGDVVAKSGNPSSALELAANLPEKAILFFFNAHRFVGRDVAGNEAVCQAAWNLRDKYKASDRMLVLLAPELVLPPELAQDVIVLEEILPGDEELAKIVAGVHKGAKLPGPKKDVLDKTVDALRGLSAFTAEQVVAMSLRKSGLDLDAVWIRKRQAIEATKGLTVYRGGETFSDIGGLDRIKEFTSGLFAGGAPPKMIVHLDEIEKMLAGSGGTSGLGDTSGVSQDALGVILRKMEDNDWTGLLAVGPPGSGKSLVSKALGNTFGLVSLAFDLGAMKGSYVGQSEGAIRQAMRVVESVAGRGGAFFIATCNRLESLPPELRRRFRLGIWFFDLPTPAERDVIWGINLKRYGLTDGERPDDRGWTGADIRNCCDVAWRLRCSFCAAAGYLVPVAKSNPEAVDALRLMARGRFLSASKPGPYQGPEEGAVTPPGAAEQDAERKVRVMDDEGKPNGWKGTPAGYL